MKALFAVWVFLARCFAWTYFKLRVYKNWSNIYRWIWEGHYKDVPIYKFERLKLLVDWIKLQRWKADSWKQLWDAVSSPQKVQAVGQDRDGDHFIGDCDEFAVYEATAITESLKAGMMVEDRIVHPRFLTITWIEKDTWKPGGHNVCLLECPQEDGSTWYSFMDYDMPSKKCPDINAVVELVRQTHKGKDKYVGVCWCVAEPDLTPWIVRWG